MAAHRSVAVGANRAGGRAKGCHGLSLSLSLSLRRSAWVVHVHGTVACWRGWWRAQCSTSTTRHGGGEGPAAWSSDAATLDRHVVQAAAIVVVLLHIIVLISPTLGALHRHSRPPLLNTPLRNSCMEKEKEKEHTNKEPRKGRKRQKQDPNWGASTVTGARGTSAARANESQSSSVAKPRR